MIRDNISGKIVVKVPHIFVTWKDMSAVKTGHMTTIIILCNKSVRPERPMRSAPAAISMFGSDSAAFRLLTATRRHYALLLFLVCVSFTIIGQPRNSVLIRRV